MQTTVVPIAASRSLDRVEIRQRLAEGQSLVRLKQLESAAVLLWSAFESAVRLSLTELGQQTDDPIWISDTIYGLSAQAVAYGVIDPEDRDVLLRLIPMQEAAVQGSATLVDSDLLQRLGMFTERTLDEMGQPSSY